MGLPLVIYHGGGCPDGFGAALAAYVGLERQGIEAQFYGASHGPIEGIELDQLSDSTVYLLDFAYKRDQMKILCAAAHKVVVIDHHISAQKDLLGLDHELDNLELNFDMERSGTVMAWDYFHTEPAPRLLRCIQDRDLWQFREPDSQNINAALMSKPFTFDTWRQYLDDDKALAALIPEGSAINRFREQMISHHSKRAVMGKIAGYDVPVVNCPREIVSELVGSLAEGHPFAAGYSDNGNQRGWSLRSTPDGLDVSVIATRLGGGGHARAAGFTTELPQVSVEVGEAQG
ncbi:MAG: DHHA1 domain-containing protein [Ketobacteraceae bacterium]|nr:DHHA1 domain-containing protein [Ketobacteraceae bacterium]